MNVEYFNNEENIMVSDEKGNITKRSNKGDINEILLTENKIEFINDEIDHSKWLVKQHVKFKKMFSRLGAALPITICPFIIYEGVVKGGIVALNALVPIIPVVAIFGGILIVSSRMSSKIINENNKLLVDLENELVKNQDKLNELNKANDYNKKNKVNTNEIKRVDIEQVKRDIGYIIAESYYNLYKDKFIKDYKSGVLHEKLPFKSHDDIYVYDALEEIIKNNLNSPKVLTKQYK